MSAAGKAVQAENLVEQLRRLFADGHPRSSRRAFEALGDAAERVEEVSKAIYYLRNEGYLAPCGQRDASGRLTYRLADPDAAPAPAHAAGKATAPRAPAPAHTQDPAPPAPAEQMNTPAAAGPDPTPAPEPPPPPRAPVPEGYVEDSFGRLVPLGLVRPQERARDRLVRELVAECRAVQAQLAHLKGELLARVAGHLHTVAQDYGVELTGARGDVALVSYDGRLKVERVMGERIQVTEAVRAAEALVREILDEIQDPTARALTDRAFRRHRKTGELSASRLIDLLGVEIDDPRWRQAQRAVKDALSVAGTTTYFRAYERAESDQPWRQIVLNFSALAPVMPADAGEEAQ